MVMPTPAEVTAAKGALTGTRGDVTTDENKIKQYQSDINDLEGQIQGIRDGLPKKELDAEDAKTAAEKMLRGIEEEIDLHIKAMESSVLQGGTATFEAEYDKTNLPNQNLHDLGVQLRWDTGGCSIQHPGTRHSKEITVDTSSVQPGDYGISVSLTFI